MKNRIAHVGSSDKEKASTSKGGHFKSRMKNKQRLGGNGLSLQAFANAKSNNAYNPHLIKKQREMYKSAKIVKKFKQKFQNGNYMENTLSLSCPEEMGADRVANQKNVVGNKKKGSLQFVREEYERKQEEIEKTKREREAMIQAKQEERARAESKRKALRQSMFKKTRHGQPVMKYRIEHLLQGIKDDQHP